MDIQNKEFFAIEKNLLIGVLEYLDTRPHKEVAQAINALKSLPPVRLQEEKAPAKKVTKVVPNESK